MNCIFYLNCENQKLQQVGPISVRDTREAKRFAGRLLRSNRPATAVEVWEDDGTLYRVTRPIADEKVVPLRL